MDHIWEAVYGHRKSKGLRFLVQLAIIIILYYIIVKDPVCILLICPSMVKLSPKDSRFLMVLKVPQG